MSSLPPETQSTETGQPDSVHVVALVLHDGQGRVLVQKRPEAKHQGGLWEFPGGKVESGESPQQALQREIREELGYETGATGEPPRPLIQLPHDYPDKRVFLDVWELTDSTAPEKIRPLENQPIQWIRVEELPQLAMPAADRPVVQALRLPDYYWITPALASSSASVHRASPQAMQKWLAEARKRLDAGVPMVQFRSKTVPKASRALVLKALHGWCQEKQVPLIFNGDLAEGKAMLEYGIADGLHLDAGQLMALSERPVAANAWLSASAHDRQELEQAGRIGVDFVSLSPVLKTATHPEAQPLGWAGFAQAVREATVPVYALGGMALTDRAVAREHGGQGVAGIRLPAEKHPDAIAQDAARDKAP